MVDERKKIYEIDFDTTKARAGLKELDKGLDKLSKTVRKTEKEKEQLAKKAERDRKARLREAIRDGRAWNRFQIKLEKQTTAATKREIREREKAAKAAHAARTKRLRALSSNIKTFSQNWNRYVVLPIAAGSAAAIKFTVDFNKGMANVASLIPGNTERVMELREELLDLSVQSGKSLEDLTGGLYETISAFGDAEDTMDKLTIASQASVAGLSSTKEALSLLSAVTKGYGDTSAEALQNASDLAFMTVKLGQTTFPELAASMGRVIPLAAQMNTKQSELFATMATLTGVTGNAAEVSTQLASIYSAFLKPTEKLTAASRKLGFETASAMLRELGLRDSLIALQKETKGSESELAKMLKRKEALVKANAKCCWCDQHGIY
jgi:hypothetical protein